MKINHPAKGDRLPRLVARNLFAIEPATGIMYLSMRHPKSQQEF
jgi:hypothetical protein